MEKISFIPQKENKIIYRGQGPGVIIFFSGIMFTISILAFGGTFLYKNFTEKQVDDLESSLNRAKSAFDVSFISELDIISSKIDIGKKLFNEHGYLSGLFAFLENNTLKNVAFTSLDYDAEENKVNLNGRAKSYSSLASQADAFKQDVNVEAVNISKLSLREGGFIDFSVEIEFIPSFFSYLSLNNQ